MFKGRVDREKVVQIGMEMMPLGVEFEAKLKEIAKKYSSEYGQETTEALINILAALIHALARDGKVLYLMIELLHREYVSEMMREIVPPEEVEKMMEELKTGKSTPKELKDFISDILEKDIGKIPKKADSKKPNYLG